MLVVRNLWCFFFLHLLNAYLQINLHLTDSISDDNSNDDLQHDCLYVAAFIEEENDPRQIISYCMSDWPSTWNIMENKFDRKFTFAQLSKQHVTSQQLYLWSAPMDVIERYQLYLNEVSNARKISMEAQLFYNCTLPSFGPECQYALSDYKSHHLSLDEIVHDYYRYNIYEPSTLTCYRHLQCDRGPHPSCLDWSEVCDGKVDCLDGGHDEKYCWQLEIHECSDNEYQCSNGQCIHKTFFRDDIGNPDCLDKSDEHFKFDRMENKDKLITVEPTFTYEDVTCAKPNHQKGRSLTSSCTKKRQELLLRAILSIKPSSMSDECWSAFKCIIKVSNIQRSPCETICGGNTCRKIVEKTCPDILYVPAVPVLFGHVYFLYQKNESTINTVRPIYPKYVCHKNELLHFDNDTALLLFNNATCLRAPGPGVSYSVMQRPILWLSGTVDFTFRSFWMFQPLFYNDSVVCIKSTMYQCINSVKCISRSRLFDGIQDCYHKDDEEISMMDKNCLAEQNLNNFKCETTNECISRYLVGDRACHCTIYDDIFCDDEDRDVSYAKNTISFQTICDGFNHLLPQDITGENETDETNCEQWPLNNIYTRCDGFWHFLNGSDEINCDPSPLLNCSSDNHICVSFTTNKLMCLPIEKANDGHIDCIGAADEPQLCRLNITPNSLETFYCNGVIGKSCITTADLCDDGVDCVDEEDQRACKNDDIISTVSYGGICTRDYELYGSDVAKVLCRLFLKTGQRWRVYFALRQIPYLVKEDVIHESSRLLPHPSIIRTVQHYQQRCHRGLDLQVWLDKEKNMTKSTCLCPPSFYGDICQYQNQRVSLTVQFRVTSDSVQIPFVLIISLIDDSNERMIHSYEQITYMSSQQCQTKFNIYLLYSTRPKDQTKHYSIHIDVYEKISLIYRGSVLKPLIFPFLPVHRLAFQLDIPRIRDHVERCSYHQCVNGKCTKYFHDPYNTAFCQCNRGWSGRHCTIRHISTCSVDSLYIGMLANQRSLCVCPLNKMGNRCLLDNSVCQMNETCHNRGACIPADQYGASKQKFVCICPKGFTGSRCEVNETKLIVSFDKNIVLPSSVLVHFIEVKLNAAPIHTTTFKTIPMRQDMITIHWLLPFHITFIDLLDKNYYLAVVQEIYKPSVTIKRTLNSLHRCLHISEIFNKTIANYSLLRRIKYYHLPCQTNSSQLLCFYDETHLCFCQKLDQSYVTNCLEFDHNMNMDCFGQSGCENGGHCFQENNICPRTSSCQCLVCFYGSRCQLSTSGYSLSLDAILGYHIRPNIDIAHQSHVVLISLVLTMIIIIAGIINGVLSLITFTNKKILDIGCGLYLLCSSIITLLAMIIFALKFWILLLTQMSSIKNRSFLHVQCISTDFLLRFCLTMDQWLTACVAIERAFITIKGISFDQKKTKLVAKWTISGLIFVTLSTTIHDPIYRRLFDEDNDEEERTWCIVNYPSIIQHFNLLMNIFHFIIPFIINLISAIIIIITKARRRVTINTQQTYKQILNEQFQQHKNLLIGPSVLIILGIPRLIISITLGCMKSTSDPWLFLVGYYISLIPPITTFILFVLPSTIYKEAFHKALSRYRNMMRIH